MAAGCPYVVWMFGKPIMYDSDRVYGTFYPKGSKGQLEYGRLPVDETLQKIAQLPCKEEAVKALYVLEVRCRTALVVQAIIDTGLLFTDRQEHTYIEPYQNEALRNSIDLLVRVAQELKP